MTVAQKPTGWDQEVAVMRRPLPRIDALLQAEKLPAALDQVARGSGVSLSRGPLLLFGRVYTVTRNLTANRSGALKAGDTVRFLGQYVFPYDNGLRLHLEPADQPGAHFDLEFEGNFPEADGVVRMLDDKNTSLYFAVHPNDPVPARAAALHAVSATLLETLEETERLREQAYDAALPDYERRVLDLVETHRLQSNVAYAHVRGEAGSETVALDHKGLAFGTAYKTVAPVFGNRSGIIAKGDTVYFKGASTRYGEEVTLWFERDDSALKDVIFYPTNDAAAAQCRPLNTPAAYFVPLGTPTDRSIELTQVRKVLDDLRQQREAQT